MQLLAELSACLPAAHAPKGSTWAPAVSLPFHALLLLPSAAPSHALLGTKLGSGPCSNQPMQLLPRSRPGPQARLVLHPEGAAEAAYESHLPSAALLPSSPPQALQAWKQRGHAGERRRELSPKGSQLKLVPSASTGCFGLGRLSFLLSISHPLLSRPLPCISLCLQLAPRPFGVRKKGMGLPPVIICIPAIQAQVLGKYQTNKQSSL